MNKIASVEVSYQERTYRLAIHDHQDVINRSLSQGHFYEEDLLREIARLGRRGVYIDVGAHIGNHTLFFAAECPSTKVISVEPWPPSHELCRRTLKANHLAGKVRLINCPAAEQDGDLVAYIPPQSYQNTGMGYTLPQGQIVSVSVDGIMSRLARDQAVALIKIDVEGFELPVLHGSRQTIKRWRPIIAVETQTRADRENIEEFLVKGFGYTWKGQYCATPTQLYLPGAPPAPA